MGPDAVSSKNGGYGGGVVFVVVEDVVSLSASVRVLSSIWPGSKSEKRVSK